MKRRIEPFWWSLFGAGGVMSALFLPILLLVFAIAVPLGWISAPDYEVVSGALGSPLVRLVIWAILSLSFFHWAHRFRFTLEEGLQLHALDWLIAFFCYGTAIVLTSVAGTVLFIS